MPKEDQMKKMQDLRKMRRLAPYIALLCLIASPALGDAPFQVSAAGAQIPEDANVNGFRLVLFYGKNQSVRGFDLGVASFSDTSSAEGITMTWGLSRVTGRSSGLASSFINIHRGEDTGVNAAFINAIKTMRNGVNLGFVNVTEESSKVDVGGLSISKRSKVQVGFFNVTNKIDNVQIGILNIAENGFFPMFPLFNFPKK
jgi:hypothetical protein